MRILRFIFISLAVISLLGAATFFIGREVLLQLGVSRVRQALTSLRRIAVNTGPYFQECQKKGAVADENVIGTIQLRFTSSTEFVLEVVCAQFQLDPVLVSSHTLPPYVTKIPGQSGIIWGEARSGVGLTTFGRSKAVVVEGREAKVESYQPTSFVAGPAASCEGYGFMCCPPDTSMGGGEQLTGVLNCPKSCFSSCTVRPVILSFTTQPFFDPKTRELTVGKGEQVEFSYVFDLGKSPTGTAEIDYGDGTSEPAQLPRGLNVHGFDCARSQCRYEVTLTLRNDQNVEAAITSANKVTIIVNN